MIKSSTQLIDYEEGELDQDTAVVVHRLNCPTERSIVEPMATFVRNLSKTIKNEVYSNFWILNK